MADMEALVTFPSVHYALKAERAFRKHRLDVDMIPVPRAISSDCGICAKVVFAKLDRVLEIMKKNIRYEEIYRCEKRGLIRHDSRGTGC